MIQFRQVILPGDTGSDVLAVKHALRAIGAKGAGAMTLSPTAGPAFVAALRNAQQHAAITVDGKYGKQSHAVIAPHFTAADEQLYKTAKLRGAQPAPAGGGNAAAHAKLLLKFREQGKYHPDNPGDLADIQKTADGQPVHSQSGQLVHIDARVMQVLVHLINIGHAIGTFAICSDHHNDGPHGHAGGKAVDISTIDGHAINQPSARDLVIKIDKELHHAGALTPRQLISGGVGNKRDAEISALSIPGADAFFGAATMGDHCNHIHVGY